MSELCKKSVIDSYTKAKMKNRKRRRKRKHHQNLQKNHHHQPNNGTSNHLLFSETASDKSTLKQHLCDNRNTLGAISKSVRSAATAWNNIYASAVRWHCQHQNNYWRNLAEEREREIECLRDALTRATRIPPAASMDRKTKRLSKRRPMAQGLRNDDSTEMIDQSYVDFLIVTQRHKAKLAMTEETGSSNDDSVEETMTTTLNTVGPASTMAWTAITAKDDATGA